MPDTLADTRWNLLWAAQRSQRYHSRRAAFFTRWNKATAFVGVLGGSAVIGLIGHEYLPTWVPTMGAAIVVLMSGLDLVVGTATMAHKHDDLRRRFGVLESAIRRNATPDADTRAEWTAQRLTIEADEPPCYVALDLLCENELARSYAHLAQTPRVRVPWYQAATAQLWPWPNA